MRRWFMAELRGSPPHSRAPTDPLLRAIRCLAEADQADDDGEPAGHGKAAAGNHGTEERLLVLRPAARHRASTRVSVARDRVDGTERPAPSQPPGAVDAVDDR